MEQNHNDEVVIRTMESDVKGLGQGGGEVIPPQPIKTEESKQQFEIPGYTGPEKPIFTPRPGAVSQSEAMPQATSRVIPRATMPQTRISFQNTETVAVPVDGKTLKIIGVVVVIMLIIAAFGFLGYFVVSYFIN